MTGERAYSFDHIERLSDHHGLYEHARHTTRRAEHGYCTDDNARLLVVTSREPDHGAAHRLSRLALGFVLDAQSADGSVRNRKNRHGRWTDHFGTEDCWGRSVWGLGVAAARHEDHSIREWADRGLGAAMRQRSEWPRAMAYAVLGACEVAGDHRHRAAACQLMVDALAVIGPVPAGDWHWPEPRLRYGNAVLAEAVVAAGIALNRSDDVERGLHMLDWLLRLELHSGHLSVTGVGGRGPNDMSPQFDQQPIEVAAMADACARAFDVTGDHRWVEGVDAAAAWFNGDNDAGLVMFDRSSGGGYDGLHADAVNLNQGAESTLALISTMQRANACSYSR